MLSSLPQSMYVLVPMTIKQGDVFTFSKGLVHFEIVKFGKEPAATISAFNSQNQGREDIPTTLFTTTHPVSDNVLKEVNQDWLGRTFTNYGVVKDAFIPNKRSRRTGSKFGFVRYDCHASARVAISKSNGLWDSDKKIYVKQESFDQYKNKSDVKIPLFQRPEVLTSSHGILRNQGIHFDRDKLKRAKELLSGETNKGGRDGNETEKGLESRDQVCRRVSLKPAGNGWLYRSAVAKLHRLISINELKIHMARMGLDNIDIKALGGRSVILTCPSRDEMEKMVKECCLQRWFSETNPWDGQAACAERFVWLCCFGIPLNAKILIATNIFKKIDEWIILEVKGKSYKVKVMEDSCDQPHEAEKQIPRASLASSSQSDEESKE
ncbi:hypothetical protein RHMOL_Rhmol11G0167900 [Rhododendron molle]|uniref:Uncharacterized protein n=1 Tax=Rhododendron molle TaxID=49168 RepID=A0ACC0LT11_RHOML|nr:hypothetical protein RHMOL_Rhmol11G0167900 [Rhododendron molle]